MAACEGLYGASSGLSISAGCLQSPAKSHHAKITEVLFELKNKTGPLKEKM
jgi:hypothetical protein